MNFTIPPKVSKSAAKAIAALHRWQVRCEKCKREQPVDASKCFDRGWPKCCGYTMTLLTKNQPTP